VSAGLPPAVLLGGAATAVPVARSLAAAGVSVTALGGPIDAVRWSRACDRFIEVEAAADVQQRWREWLLAEAPAGAVVLACSDDGVELLARHRDELSGAGLVLSELNDELALAMLDKRRTFEVAVAAGMEMPLSLPVGDIDEAQRAAERIGFPCVLKPLHSHEFARHFSPRKLFVANSPEDLRSALALTASLGLEMLLMEIVPGPDSHVETYSAYVDERGRILCEATKRKLRQFPAKFGVGTIHVTDWNPDAVAAGRQFVARTSARGLINYEFKRDARDGRLKLIECNYRFTAAIACLHAAGYEIALFTYRRLTGGALPDMRYRRGVSSWNPVLDLRALPEYRRLGELTIRGWLRPLLRRQTFFVARLDDPLPTIMWNARLVGRALRKLL
jgi:D-aspartate ligase